MCMLIWILLYLTAITLMFITFVTSMSHGVLGLLANLKDRKGIGIRLVLRILHYLFVTSLLTAAIRVQLL